MGNFKLRFYSWKVVKWIGLITFWMILFFISRMGYIQLSTEINNYLTNTKLTGEQIVNNVQEIYFTIMGVTLVVLTLFKAATFTVSRKIDFSSVRRGLKATVKFWIAIGLFAFMFTATTETIPMQLYFNALLGYMIAALARTRDEKMMFNLFSPVIEDVLNGNTPTEFNGFKIKEIKKSVVTSTENTFNQVSLIISDKFRLKYKIRATSNTEE